MRRSLKKFIHFIFGVVFTAVKKNKFLTQLIHNSTHNRAFSNLLQHENMLADSVRVDTYHRALQKHIQPNDTVIDLGTGTGILALLAAKRAKKVYAIDYSELTKVGHQLAIQNNIDNIDFIQTHSHEFHLDEKVDVIIHEQIGDDLFNENMIENLLDLKQRYLKASGKILPGKFELFIEPVTLKKEYKIPFIWENNLHGIDYSFLKHAQQHIQHRNPSHHSRLVVPAAVDYFLAHPEPALSFDINTMKTADDFETHLNCERKISRRGTLDGLLLYFKVIFDDEIFFDTCPLSPKTHWANRLFRLESKSYQQGETLSYNVILNDILRAKTWSITVLP